MRPTRENVQPRAGSSYACLEIDLPEFDHNYHYHPEVEITWIVESSGQRLVGDSIQPFEKGDLVLIGSNLPHKYSNWQQKRARSRVIQFKPDLFGAAFWELNEFASTKRLLNEASRGLCFSDDVKADAQKQMRTIFRTADPSRKVLELIELLRLLSEDTERSPIASIHYAEPVKLKKIDRLQRLLNYLEAHCQEPVPLAKAAEVAALHPQSLSRFLQQHLGMNFQDYLIQLRLNRACRRLLETEATVAEIAYASGFDNLANFNRQFQKVYNTTPTEYRKHV